MTGWTRDQIRAAVAAKGTSLYGLSKAHGLRPNALATGLLRRHPKENRILADFLGRPVHELWPDWYSAEDHAEDLRSRKMTAEMRRRILEAVAGGKTLTRLRDDDPAFPTLETIRAYRRTDPDFDAALTKAMTPRSGLRVSTERLDAVVDALKAGVSLGKQTIVPYETIRTIRIRDTGFRALTAPLIRAPCIRLRDGESRSPRRMERFARFSQLEHREAMTRALRSDEVYALALRAVPRGLEPFMRDDVVSEVVVGLLDGTIQPDQASAAARRFASRYFSRDLSMDRDMGNGRTLAGLISDGTFNAGGTGIRVRERAW